ncbi:MAG: hypothetical protein HZC42_05610 [Candidatus Eisenbacteria bacterium]|nr:hypothetical protein [Candidatus Eisenbacteria bacterium]
MNPPSGRRDKSALKDLLLVEYRLDPGAVEYLVEVSRNLGIDAGASVVCDVLRADRLRTEVQRLNLADFVRRACRDDSVARVFRKTLVHKVGRCVGHERRWLSAQIGPRGSQRTEPPAFLAKPAQPGELELTDLTGSVETLPEVLNRTARVPSDVPSLAIRLGDFTYATTLAILAQFILSRHLQGQYSVECGAEMHAYLERIGFEDVLRNRPRTISPDPMDWAVGLTRISTGSATETVSEKIVDIIATFANLEAPERSSLFILVAEMIENIHRHACAPVDGFAVAQVYPRKLKMGITFVDGGIGIRKSFEEGQPSVDVSQLKEDADFLERACDLHVTSKASGHSGYGLYLLSRVVANNRGTFVLTSGSATVVAYLRRGEVSFDRYVHRPWQGTIVSVILDLNERISTRDVYKTMPVPEDWEIDELFE